MTNIDPFLVATRESQGQPVDAVGRPDLIERLRRSAKADLGSLTYARLGHTALEAATTLSEAQRREAEKDARIASLEAELFQSRNFWSDELSASRAECEGLRAALKKAEYSLTKDSLCEAEKIDDALYVIRAALSQKETGYGA